MTRYSVHEWCELTGDSEDDYKDVMYVYEGNSDCLVGFMMKDNSFMVVGLSMDCEVSYDEMYDVLMA
jgi:hypothetical protein